MDAVEQAKKDIEQDMRISAVEKEVEKMEQTLVQIQELTVSVHDLANNMSKMVEEQKKVSDRLDVLEKKPSDDMTRWKWIILTAATSAIVGAIIGNLPAIIHAFGG